MKLCTCLFVILTLFYFFQVPSNTSSPETSKTGSHSSSQFISEPQTGNHSTSGVSSEYQDIRNGSSGRHKNEEKTS